MTYLCPIFIDLSFLGQDCWRIFIICLLYVPCPYSFSETNEKYVTYVGISYYNELFLQRMVKKKLFSKNADSYLDAFIVDAQKKCPIFAGKYAMRQKMTHVATRWEKSGIWYFWAVCLRELVRVIVNQNCCCCTNRRGDNFSWMTRYRILKYSHSYYLWHYCAFFSQLCAFM